MTSYLATLLLATQINFFSTDPRDDWSTLSTEHFRIHYLEEASDIAERVAKISEPVYDEMTERLSWEPADVIHVVLLTRDDIANGFSTPFPYNMVALNIAPPPAGSGLDEYDEWISLLFTHELTHTIHVDMVKGFNKVWRTLLGRTIIPPTSIPNSVQPQWLIEGLAVDHETTFSSGGRGNSSFVEMYFRTAAMEDDLLPIERGTYWNDIYPYGSAAYWYGVRFHQYLRENYGAEKIYEFADLNSRWVLPSFFNFKTRKIFGKSFDRIWNEWRAQERRAQLDLMSRYQPRLFPSLLVNDEGKTSYMRGTPAYDSRSNTFYLVSGRRYEGQDFYKISFDELQNPSALTEVEDVATPGGRLSYLGEDFVLYARTGRPSTYRLTSDIYAMSVKTQKSVKLSKGLRLFEPTGFQDQIVAVRTNNMKSQLVRLKKRFLYGHLDDSKEEKDSDDDTYAFFVSGYSDDLSDEEKKKFEASESELKSLSNDQIDLQLASIPQKEAIQALKDLPGLKPAESADEVEVLFEAKGFDHISHPSFSPDGKFIVFTMTLENESRDLFILDIATGSVTRLTQDPYFELHPSFSEDGEWIVFSSDRELGQSGQRVYNAYAIHRQSRKLKQLTDFWTGVYYPRLSSNHLVYGHYGNEGFRPAIMKIDLKELDETPVVIQNLAKKKPPLIEKRGETPASEISESSYKMGDTLLPHFLIPFWFYTETDTAVGALTGSRDPLGKHEWQAFGYHFFTPNRPGGSVAYINSQIPFVKLSVSGGAFISNYGSIWLLSDGSLKDYYERIYRGQLSLGYGIFNRVLGGKVSAGHYIYYEDRSSLLPRPNNLVDEPSDFNDPAAIGDALITPEEGQSLGFGTNLSWTTGASYAPYAINPVNGASATFNIEYTPEFGDSSDFHTLVTTLNTNGSLRLYKELSLAMRAAGGMQWLDVLYQRTFRLGGSIGQSPFANSRRFSLRGLPEGALRGEGVLSGSLEVRFPLLKHFLGFGTAPVWVKNIHAAAFIDAGQSFQRQDDEFVVPAGNGVVRIIRPSDYENGRFTASVGGEIRSNISLWYAVDYIFRLGYGRVWYFVGQDILTNDDAIDEIYVQVGPSF